MIDLGFFYVQLPYLTNEFKRKLNDALRQKLVDEFHLEEKKLEEENELEYIIDDEGFLTHLSTQGKITIFINTAIGNIDYELSYQCIKRYNKLVIIFNKDDYEKTINNMIFLWFLKYINNNSNYPLYPFY